MFFTGASFYILKDRIFLSRVAFYISSMAAVAAGCLNQDVFFVIYTFSVAYNLFYLAYSQSSTFKIYNRVGDYSYGIYIYAFPVQQSVAALVSNTSPATMFLFSMPISFALAALSWHFLKKKSLSKKSSVVKSVQRLLSISRA
jgi:peptidoglycan/LPS O-acetylase OafA/YrhL